MIRRRLFFAAAVMFALPLSLLGASQAASPAAGSVTVPSSIGQTASDSWTGTIQPGDLPPHVTAGLALGPAPSLGSPQTLAETERILIMQALERSGWSHSRAAEALGIGRTTLWRKLKEYGIDR